VESHEESTRTYAPVNNPNSEKAFDAKTGKTKVRIAFTRLPALTGDPEMWIFDEEEGDVEVAPTDTNDFTFTFEIVGDAGSSSTPRTPITNDDFDPCEF